MFIFDERGRILNSRYISMIDCRKGVDVDGKECWLAVAIWSFGDSHGNNYLFREDTEEATLLHISHLRDNLNGLEKEG